MTVKPTILRSLEPRDAVRPASEHALNQTGSNEGTSPALRDRRLSIRADGSRGSVDDGPAGGWYAATKAVVESALAAVLLVACTPVILASALVVRLTSRGPVFYSQVRVGRGGRLFTIYKVRTMAHDCEAASGPRWCLPGDPRVTRVGRLLRRTHLDELPQLVNVIRGDMSLVGPRPERPEFLPVLEEAIPSYRRRLAVRPGVTGLAQVQLPADSDLDSVRRKLAYDIHYVENVGLSLDLRVLAATAFYVVGAPPRWSQRLCLLPSPAEVIGRRVADDSLMDTQIDFCLSPVPER